MTEYGGIGGYVDGRPIDRDDPFETMIARVFGERMKTDNKLCRHIWSALANVQWRRDGDEAFYSFRAAGDMIAAIRGNGNYLDWYCSGPYATIADEIRDAFGKEGWTELVEAEHG